MLHLVCLTMALALVPQAAADEAHRPSHRRAHPVHAPTHPTHLHHPPPKARRVQPAAPHAPLHRAHAPLPAKEVAQDVEPVEAVEPVEPVEAVAPAADGKTTADKASVPTGAPEADKVALTPAQVAGHLHAAVVHLPIAWLALWAAFEALALLYNHPWLRMAGLPLGLCTTLGFLPAVYTGLMRFWELAGVSDSYDAAPALLHRNLMFAGWLAVVLATGLRLSIARPQSGGWARAAYVLLVWAAFGITGWSAHLGGCMVYGDDFLPF